MISAAGNIQIADFGLSVHNVHLDNGGGASCDRTGTPGYMAPELFSPEELKKKFLSASRTACQAILRSRLATLRCHTSNSVTMLCFFVPGERRKQVSGTEFVSLSN